GHHRWTKLGTISCAWRLRRLGPPADLSGCRARDLRSSLLGVSTASTMAIAHMAATEAKNIEVVRKYFDGCNTARVDPALTAIVSRMRREHLGNKSIWGIFEPI